MGLGDRLRQVREEAGYKSAAEAARAIGVNRFTYSQHENNTQGRGFNKETAVRYARFYRINVSWLLTGKGAKRSTPRAPLVGYIGAGAIIYPIDDHAQGQGLELIDLPPGIEEPCVAARIRGDSMHPFKDGWVIFWNKDQDGVPETCIGQLCVVKLRDGQMLVKELFRGSKKGIFDLRSWNASPIEDAPVEWAARVLSVKMI